MPRATSHQTIGPFWHPLADPAWTDLTRFGARGEKVVLHGQVTDGDGAPVTDACVEVWQASPPVSDAFPGWGRCATDSDGRFRLLTVMPGTEVASGVAEAPTILVMLHARGLLKPLLTRMYFEDHPMNEQDAILQSIAPARRTTLLAKAEKNGQSGDFRFDIRLQGEGETVFFEIGA